MAIDEVIFLGAGASAAETDGAPIQNSLLKDYSENGQDIHASSSILGQFFKDFFGIDTLNHLNDIDFPTFEEILGILELSLSRSESFRKYPLTPQDPKIQNIREQIIFLIAKILKDKLQFRRTNHDALVSRLNRESRLRKTAFISLNYDILIDNALTDIYDVIDLDYGIQFTKKHTCVSVRFYSVTQLRIKYLILAIMEFANRCTLPIVLKRRLLPLR